jgi:hypothetical protein
MNGKIFKCSRCSKIHIEYKNLHFTFSEVEFVFFKDFFLKLEPEKWEFINRNSFYIRKIMVPMGHKNFSALFHATEINELKEMFKNLKGFTVKSNTIKLDKITPHISLN